MELSDLLNLLLGGGLLSSVVALITMRSTVRKARAEAETIQISNTEQATKVLVENIVNPLKIELAATRDELRETKKEFGATKREMARFRKAVESANNCRYSLHCPVLDRLREQQKGGAAEGGGPDGNAGQPTGRNPPEIVGAYSGGAGRTAGVTGRPP